MSMGNPPERGLSEIVDLFKSWIPQRSEPVNVSRDFWMPDHSCRVCYDCDVQFTIFNRRHHCRHCGRIFCARCTANSVPVACNWKTGKEDAERVRVCNYCYKQWEQETSEATVEAENECRGYSSGLSRSPSVGSMASTKSSCTANSNSSNSGPANYTGGSYQRLTYGSGLSISQSNADEADKQEAMSPTKDMDSVANMGGPSQQFGYCLNRSDDDDDYGACRSDLEGQYLQQSGDYYGRVEDVHDHSTLNQFGEENLDGKDFPSQNDDSNEFQAPMDVEKMGEVEPDNAYECDASSSIYNMDGPDLQPVDFESNGVLWFPPDPEDEEDEKDAMIFDEEEGVDAGGEFGYLRSSNSFGSGESRNKGRSIEEHKNVMKNVLDGHFRALVSQLLQVENLSASEEGDGESWLEIITSLSWEVASLLKPDTSKGGGMDPGGYVKIKCLASGRRSESSVVRGVVCRKNLAHRRMKSRIEKPRLLILGGALEYQRVSNMLSSFDTLLQQEMDHLKMAVAKIDAHHPNLLLVEKSVSRFAQDYLLAKGISLVLNMKRPLLERIARCTGAQIIPSIDHLSPTKLGHCDLFHVDKFFEEHGSTLSGGPKSTKNLMFFEDCPKPFGCTVLLRGANGDELKKVKHVVQYGVFAAYHLALETSFLADEGASLPELPLSSPITVALPDKPCGIGRSISTIPGFTTPTTENPLLSSSAPKEIGFLGSDLVTTFSGNVDKREPATSEYSLGSNSTQLAANSMIFFKNSADNKNSVEKYSFAESFPEMQKFVPASSHQIEKPEFFISSSLPLVESNAANMEDTDASRTVVGFLEDYGVTNFSVGDQAFNVDGSMSCAKNLDTSEIVEKQAGVDSEIVPQDNKQLEEQITKEEFPPSPSDHQSILVSLSTRCVWKGTVCERAHLFRIKYYGSFDKPLGRFLRDHLFDQGYRCQSCDMPSEAHVHCYTHRQGSLTISVKKLPDILLPGERDGKIWMWHRCLRCPRKCGMPPETRRVVMSDAAWGLSFGKFLELSFSNHAAASRVASCGHSLHRDCLRFYGFGKMVACFRYASIDVHSVYLPPAQLDFNIQDVEWIRREVHEVKDKLKLLLDQVLNCIHCLKENKKKSGMPDSSPKVAESDLCAAKLECILHKEKAEFEDFCFEIQDAKKGQTVYDILQINKLRRQLVILSYLWDQRLIFASGSESKLHEGFGSILRHLEKVSSFAKVLEWNSSFKSQNAVSGLNSPSPDARGGELSKGNLHPNGSPRQFSEEIQKSSLCLHQRDNQLDPISVAKEVPLSPVSNMQKQMDPLETGAVVLRSLSDGQVSRMDLSDTLDAKWTGENAPSCDLAKSGSPSFTEIKTTISEPGDFAENHGGTDVARPLTPISVKDGEGIKRVSPTLMEMPFQDFYCSINKSPFASSSLYCILNEYNPVYVPLLRELEHQGEIRFLLPVGMNGTVIPVFDDEPTSIIAYALASSDYHSQMTDDKDRLRDCGDSSTSMSFYDATSFNPFPSFDEISSEVFKSLASVDDSISSIASMSASRMTSLDPLSYTKALHVKVSFTDEGLSGKMKYCVTCYYAKRFEDLRKICCPSEPDFIRSLSRCKKWGAQGGKSNVFFAKSLDDRFIIKQVTKTELESFIKFAPQYFKYLSDSISTGSPTCLAKILGIYQVTSKQLKGGKESKIDVLVMENLLFARNLARLYDLKGSSRSRYNADSTGSNKVLLDQNLIEAMPTSPIFVGNKAKRLLERAVWNDTAFLASIDVMDYSLLVGVDEERHELVLGIIDFMRQYTWDKHLETWVKASGILGGPKNASPTVISPKQYKKRFRKAMTAYFLMVPDQWSPPSIVSSRSLSDLGEDNIQQLPVES